MLSKEQIYLSTIDPAAGEMARKYGLGVEIAEFCTAMNMDMLFPQNDAQVRQEIVGVPRHVLHGPFNELFPCAIDPLARELAEKRYAQALGLCEVYGASKLILHGGFHPKLYYPCWYVEQSVLFWKEFLKKHPGDTVICLENVLEPEPDMLRSIAEQVGDPRLRLCLDVGHCNAYSEVPAADWVEGWGEYLYHAHVHNNDGSADTHSALDCGTLPIKTLLLSLQNATVTLELPQIGSAVDWLIRKEILER